MYKPWHIFLITISIFTLGCSSDEGDSLYFTGGWGVISIEGFDELTDCRRNNNVFFNEQGSGLWTHPSGDVSGDYNQPCYDSIFDHFSYKMIGDDIRIFKHRTEIDLNWTIEINDDLMIITRPDYYTVTYLKGLNFED